MDGSFQGNDSKREAHSKLIKKWLLARAAGKTGEYGDLHIDCIDPDWKPREQWIVGGAEALQMAVALRDQHAPEFSVALGFSLTPGQNSGEFAPSTVADLIKEADASPPSLYLLTAPPESVLLRANAAASPGAEAGYFTDTDMDPSHFRDFGSIRRCHYMRFKQSHTADIFRSFVIEA